MICCSNYLNLGEPYSNNRSLKGLIALSFPFQGMHKSIKTQKADDIGKSVCVLSKTVSSDIGYEVLRERLGYDKI